MGSKRSWMFFCLGIVAAGIVFLIYTGQPAQLGSWLPLLLLLACPLMMCLPMLMGHGKNEDGCHGGGTHKQHSGRGDKEH